MSEPVMLVVTATPDPENAQALEDYSAKGPPQLVASGAVPKFRAKVVDRLVGDGTSSLVFVAEFASIEEARAAFETEAYKAAIPDRNKAFKQLDIMLVEPL